MTNDNLTTASFLGQTLGNLPLPLAAVLVIGFLAGWTEGVPAGLLLFAAAGGAALLTYVSSRQS